MKKPASEIGIKSFKLWLHLPLSIHADLLLKKNGWVEPEPDFDFEQHTYFHPQISDAITGRRKSFRLLQKKDCAEAIWEAERLDEVETAEGNFEVKSMGRYRGTIDYVEIRENLSKMEGPGERNPSLAVVTVALTVEAATQQGENGGEKDVQLTLADAQNATDWFRRVFPRWWKSPTITGDTLSRVKWGEQEWTKPLLQADYRVGGWDDPIKLFPWVKALIQPIDIDNKAVSQFGDERAYVCSEITLDCPELADGSDAARETIEAVREGDLFRLAEVDSAGNAPYPYSSEFLEPLSKTYFYDRHAPGPDGSGNTTRFVISGNHLSMIGSGYVYEKYVVGNMGKYYRHLQFLCVFEYFRLLQFSLQLTKQVLDRREGAMDDFAFREALKQTRLDFLDHTHLHHFSNVSSQLQPREMFARIYDAMGIEDMHRDLEAELNAAAEYAATCEAGEQSARAERINNMVFLGVPLSLITGVLGMNVLVGVNWPFDTVTKAEELTDWHQLFQASSVCLLVASVWWGLTRLIQRGKGTKGGKTGRKTFLLIAAGLTVTLMISGFQLNSQLESSQSIEDK